ncbi:MAG: hypothetical protein F6K47_35875 [Symploca sp. SIO2E6]|nr:hypothetical protein [Symploca sp. SIO2E6]
MLPNWQQKEAIALSHKPTENIPSDRQEEASKPLALVDGGILIHSLDAATTRRNNR